MSATLERIAAALERIADRMEASAGLGTPMGPTVVAADTVARQAEGALEPLAEHVARLAEGLERMTAVNAEIAATRREIIEQRRKEHMALLEELNRGGHADGA